MHVRTVLELPDAAGATVQVRFLDNGNISIDGRAFTSEGARALAEMLSPRNMTVNEKAPDPTAVEIIRMNQSEIIREMRGVRDAMIDAIARFSAVPTGPPPNTLGGAEVTTATQDDRNRPTPKMPSETRREYSDDDPRVAQGPGTISGRGLGL